MQSYGLGGVRIFLVCGQNRQLILDSVYAQRQASEPTPTSRPIPSLQPQSLQPPIPSVDQIAYFQMYPPIQSARHLNPAGPGPWHTLGASQAIAATASTSQQHIIQRLPPPPPPPAQTQPQDPTFREGPWEGYHSPDDISAQQDSYGYPRYREDQNGWVSSDPYYTAPV